MTNIYLPCAINATYVPIKTFITQLFEGFLFEKNPCSCKECCFSFQEVPFFVLFRGSHLKEPTSNSFMQRPMRQLGIPRLTSVKCKLVVSYFNCFISFETFIVTVLSSMVANLLLASWHKIRIFKKAVHEKPFERADLQ